MTPPTPAGSSSYPRVYLPFIDWMKCIGMFLIVMGHVAGAPTNHLLPPIYAKQLGVAFFIFVMGYSLAGESKPIRRVLFDRLFEVYLWGGVFALLLSAVAFATIGGIQLSNYEPLLLGVNVFVNNFPANPTTWYIGTYLHILVLWAVALRRMRIAPWMLASALIVEIGLRALLMGSAGRYVAYMLFTNWISVLLFGIWMGQHRVATGISSGRLRRWQAPGGIALLVAFLFGWYRLVGPRVLDYSFPFMRLSVESGAENRLLTAFGVSVVYLGVTGLVFLVTARLRGFGWVRFFARNTLFIFIAHMPVYYWLQTILDRTTLSYAGHAVTSLVVCFAGLALLSDVVTRAVRPRVLRDRLRPRILGHV